MDFDAILRANFAGQVLTGLIAWNVGFAILDRWFRYQSRVFASLHIGRPRSPSA